MRYKGIISLSLLLIHLGSKCVLSRGLSLYIYIYRYVVGATGNETLILYKGFFFFFFPNLVGGML